MALTVDWGTKVITIYQADMTLLGGSVYQLDMGTVHDELKDLEDDELGIAFPDTHRHNPEVTISGQVYARTIEFINGYTVSISPAGAYQVSCAGANHNLQDVYNNLTGPTLLPNNSAGLVVTDTSGLTATEAQDLSLLRKFHTNDYGTDDTVDPPVIRVMDDDGVTPLKEAAAWEDYDETQKFRGQGLQRRSGFVDP